MRVQTATQRLLQGNRKIQNLDHSSISIKRSKLIMKRMNISLIGLMSPYYKIKTLHKLLRHMTAVLFQRLSKSILLRIDSNKQINKVKFKITSHTLIVVAQINSQNCSLRKWQTLPQQQKSQLLVPLENSTSRTTSPKRKKKKTMCQSSVFRSINY